MPSPFDPSQSRETLFGALLDAAKRHGSGSAILEDADRKVMTYRDLILASLVLGAKISGKTKPGEGVAILLPNVSGLVALLFGLNLYGRTAGLLNFTAGSRNLVAAVKAGQLPALVTSRRFIETAKLEDALAALAAAEAMPGRPLEIIYLEDVRERVVLIDKLLALVRRPFVRSINRTYVPSPDTPAVILFTSGTEGLPKGVVLTNANLVANARQIFAHGSDFLGPADIAINPLPMFHSFGLTAGTLMGLLNGIKVVLYPSPLHYKQVPALVAKTKATLLFATDTFLQGYARAASHGDLASVRFAIAGAERVKPATRDMWGKTGAVILEGYGATECSPVIACNTPAANRAGTVGRTLPGMEVKLAPVEGVAEGGRLLVKGPNVMAGYLRAERPGVLEPPAEGWHDTGDIVTIEDGFIAIKGRAKRFAKLGGEMVSLAAVESLAAGLWPEGTHVVVSLPDARKGESLVLVTDRADADKETLLAYAKREGMPELWVPKAILVVGQVPILGSGKIDYPGVTEMARQSRPLL